MRVSDDFFIMNKLLHTICWILIYGLSCNVLCAQSKYTNIQCINWYDEKFHETIELSVYPNPSSDSFEIHLKLSCDNDDNWNIYISEVNGKIIYELSLKDCYRYWCIHKCYLGSLNIPSGLYIITLVYKQNLISRVLVLI